MAEPPSSPLKAAVGGMFLGSSAWIEGWRRRLAEEPVARDVPRKQQPAWRPGIEDVRQAFRVVREGVVASRRHGDWGQGKRFSVTPVIVRRQAHDAGRKEGLE